MRNYTYNEESMILETRTKGILKIEDIIEHYKKIGKEESLSRNLKILIDCRGTKMDIKINEIGQTYDTVKEVLLKYNDIREAILVDKPYETVIAVLFDNYNADLESYSFKVFSTEDAARYWLF
jgi:hypothetical protein